jgi:hypothetical protein
MISPRQSEAKLPPFLLKAAEDPKRTVTAPLKVKVNIKFTLEQAANAQKGSRFEALLFL